MKINLPVTGVEQRFDAAANILSTTDLKGAITYVNDDFVRISGFENSETAQGSADASTHMNGVSGRLSAFTAQFWSKQEKK